MENTFFKSGLADFKQPQEKVQWWNSGCNGVQRYLLNVDQKPQKPSQGGTDCACRGWAYNHQPRTPHLKKAPLSQKRERPEPAKAAKWVNKGGREAQEEMEQAQPAVALPWHLPGWYPGACHSTQHIPWNKHGIISSPATPACFTACVSSADAEKEKCILPKSSVGQGA